MKRVANWLLFSFTARKREFVLLLALFSNNPATRKINLRTLVKDESKIRKDVAGTLQIEAHEHRIYLAGLLLTRH
jgi:hypothetical protein